MILFAFFTDAGVPALGLAPTIDVWDSASNHPVDAQAMTEIAGGWYQYSFAAYDDAVDYVIRADGGADLADFERYVFGSNECDSSVTALPTAIEIDTQLSGAHGAGSWEGGGAAPTVGEIRAEMDSNSTQLATLVADTAVIKGATFNTATDSLEAIRDRGDSAWVTGGGGTAPTVEEIRAEMEKAGTKLTAVKEKTDNLPDSPAPADEYNTELAAIRADLNSPDQYKADVSALATAASLAIAQTDITEIKNIEGGRWKIIDNQMIFYEADNVTEIMRFNLLDADGNPSMENVMERVRV